MSSRALIALAIVLVAGDARADGWDAAYAFGASIETIGGDLYTGTLVQVDVARRVTHRVAISGIAELASATDDAKQGGIVRGLVGLDLHVVESDRAFMPNVVASLGTGTETVMWDRGTLTRSLSYVAVEYRAGFSLDDSDFIRGLDSLAFRFGIRGQLAPGVAGSTVVALCSACEPMRPPGRTVDVGLGIYMGLVFGR